MCLEPATVHATVPSCEGTNVDQCIAIGLRAKLRLALRYSLAEAFYADHVARGEREVPIAGVFAPDDKRDAHRQFELCHPWQVGVATVSSGGTAEIYEMLRFSRFVGDRRLNQNPNSQFGWSCATDANLGGPRVVLNCCVAAGHASVDQL